MDQGIKGFKSILAQRSMIILTGVYYNGKTDEEMAYIQTDFWL